MEKELKIQRRLQEDLEYLKELGYNVLGVFLQGSQNYQLDYEGSDIDTKAIIIPTFKDFLESKRPVSTTLILPSNEHIDVKDIRLMHQCFLKQNINFLEILFTKYKVFCNSELEKLYFPLIENREKIAHFNTHQALRCSAGMALEKYKALEHPYPTLIDKIEKYGYDNKQLHHIFRMRDFAERYARGEDYESCLVPRCPQFLIDIKANYLLTLEEARNSAKTLVKEIEEIKNNYILENEQYIDTEVPELLNQVLYNIMKNEFTKEILGEKNE